MFRFHKATPIEVSTEWIDYTISGLQDTDVDRALQNNDTLFTMISLKSV